MDAEFRLLVLSHLVHPTEAGGASLELLGMRVLYPTGSDAHNPAGGCRHGYLRRRPCCCNRRSFGQRVGIGDTLDSSPASTPHHASTQHGAQPPLLGLASDVRTLRVELSFRCTLRARGTPTVATGHGELEHPGSPPHSDRVACTEYTMQASYNIPHAACHFRAPHLRWTCSRDSGNGPRPRGQKQLSIAALRGSLEQSRSLHHKYQRAPRLTAHACNPPRDSEENAVQLHVGSSTIGRNDVHAGMGLLSRSQTAKRRTQSKSDIGTAPADSSRGLSVAQVPRPVAQGPSSAQMPLPADIRCRT
mmetsp:Transcript_10693/g.25235  ORF Transcript_10693/g.25235 Transcript_10693/m.25235 type:complete len:304 (-) Transcript_10693:30-941(-)